MAGLHSVHAMNLQCQSHPAGTYQLDRYRAEGCTWLHSAPLQLFVQSLWDCTDWRVMCCVRCRVDLPGGPLQIEWREADNHVYMTGPAEPVFTGSLQL